MLKLMKKNERAQVRSQIRDERRAAPEKQIHLGRTLCWVVLGLACLDLVGWVLHLPLLTSVVPHYSTMKPNTAIGLASIAVACWMWQRLDGPAQTWRRWTAVVAAVVSGVVGFGTLAEYVLGRSLGLDDLILRVPADRFGDAAGRPSLGAAGCLALMSVGLLLLERMPRVSVGCLLATGVWRFLRWWDLCSMRGRCLGWHGFGRWRCTRRLRCYCWRWRAGGAAEREPIHSLMQQTYREGRTRWLLVGVTLLPLLVSLPPMLALRKGVIDAGFALALVVVVLTLLQTILLWKDSVTLMRVEMRRGQVERALVQSEKLAAVGRLSASIAHELRNPLEAVNTLMYLIRDSETLEESRSFAMTARVSWRG